MLLQRMLVEEEGFNVPGTKSKRRPGTAQGLIGIRSPHRHGYEEDDNEIENIATQSFLVEVRPILC